MLLICRFHAFLGENSEALAIHNDIIKLIGESEFNKLLKGNEEDKDTEIKSKDSISNTPINSQANNHNDEEIEKKESGFVAPAWLPTPATRKR
jgi:hypothetical protein